jgi:hypothetical protein
MKSRLAIKSKVLVVSACATKGIHGTIMKKTKKRVVVKLRHSGFTIGFGTTRYFHAKSLLLLPLEEKTAIAESEPLLSVISEYDVPVPILENPHYGMRPYIFRPVKIEMEM